MPKAVLVFSSSLLGIHESGLAKEARLHWGALTGQEEGMQGNAYAIPTKDSHGTYLRHEHVQLTVNKFLAWATVHQENYFVVSELDWNFLNSLAFMFSEVPDNVYLPPVFVEALRDNDYQRGRQSKY